MPDRPTAERGHLPASIFERNRVLRCRNHPKTSENLIFCELRNFNSETSSLVTLPSSGESANFRFLVASARGRERPSLAPSARTDPAANRDVTGAAAEALQRAVE